MKIIKRDNPIQRPLSVWDDFFGFPTVEDFFPTNSFRSLSADLWEDKNAVYVKMAMPGIKNEDIKVEIHDDVITISGNSKVEEKEDSEKKYYFKSMERSYQQSFRLPSKVDSDKTEAKLENGVLTVTLPKTEDQKPKVIKVN